ncbi:unnamed protein product [Mytilus coruscus]|uniref:C1q domain-containing protein n=1 Tax=Mytilus coruscus TaxID=42192 RepID=A0A6J8BRZ7_MYTCO|nr:unnamed protein product [Mytilus coruscus]
MSFCSCNGFLLDDKTQPPTNSGTPMSDEHYKFVMQFVIQERQSRLQLEEYVNQLKQELVTTKTELATEINNLKQCGCASDIKNKTITLQQDFGSLKRDYDVFKTKNALFSQELTVTKNRSVLLENEVAHLQQLQSVSDLQTVFDLKNLTSRLAQEIQATNSRQQAITSEANARKQDFLALYQRIQVSEKDLENLSVDMVERNKKINETDLHTSLRMQLLESNVNLTISKLDEISDRALLTVSSKTATISDGNVFQFTDVLTSDGISNLSSVNTSGIFTCEKHGFYLTSNTKLCHMTLYLNTKRIARTSKGNETNFQSHSLQLFLKLKIGDTLSVKAEKDVYDWGNVDSMFSILQVK